MRKELELRVRKTIQKFGMLAGGERVVVGVSGGADSVALLLSLHSLASDLRLILTVAHLNHGLRGAEADTDEQFVRELSSRLQLHCMSECIDIKKAAQTEKRNVEELAREKRYTFLKRCAREVHADRIAVGHTLNDQAETALFRFLRGSGIAGLAAIHPVNGIVIRPLLECSRRIVLDYLKQENSDYREDATNSDLRYSRNRLRHEVIPFLEKHFNRGLIATLAREALTARETWSFVESQAREAFDSMHFRRNTSIILPIAELKKLHTGLQKEVLRQAIRECLGSLRGISSVHIHNIANLLEGEQSGSRIHLPQGCAALRQFKELVFVKDRIPEAAFAYELGIPGRCVVPEANAEFICRVCPAPDLRTIRGTCATMAFLDPSVMGPLTIRSRREGDRYGGPGHHKTKKMLIDSKIPLSERSTLPMLVSGSSVLWIPGFRPAKGFEVKKDSPSCVVVEMSKRK